MRTRFVPTDYSATAAGDGPSEAVGFDLLPLPDLSPRDYPSSYSDFWPTFDDIPWFGISSEVDKLPIDDALSIFLSDVLPSLIDCSGVEELMVDSSRKKQAIVLSEEKDGKDSNDKGGDGLRFMQFETAEMADISMLAPQKSTFHSQFGQLCVLSPLPEFESTLDQLNSKVTLQNHAEIERVLYSVDKMNTEYSMEEKSDLLLEGASFRQEVNSHDIKFPIFEADVESLETLKIIYTLDEILIFGTVPNQEIEQTDEIFRNNKELLGSNKFDFIKHLFHHPLVIQCLDNSRFASQLDLISIIELPQCHEYLTHHLEGSDDDLIWLMNPVAFDAFLFIDANLYIFHETFSDAAKVMEVETCESLFGEAMNFRSFSELIVCNELTLMDDSFKTLPIPIFSDDENNYSLQKLVKELFPRLDWKSSSASDTLYLDWCFLEDDCESEKYSSCQKILWEIDTFTIDPATKLSNIEQTIFDFILSEGHSAEPNAENYNEKSNFSTSDVSVCKSASKMDSSGLPNHGDEKIMNADLLVKPGVENVSMLGESMSSDLEFFMNPRNYLAGTESKHVDKTVNSDTVCQVPVSINDSAAPVASRGDQQKLTVRVHQIWLSDVILRLIDCLWKNFLAMLGNDKEFIQIRTQYQASNDLKLLNISNEKFMQCLQNKITLNTHLARNDDNILVLAMLFTIKQMAFYLCYYGIQATFLYVDGLIASLQCLRTRLHSFYNLIRDENLKAEKEPGRLHPSLSVMEEILKTELNDSKTKVLIVCDQIFLLSLKSLLISLQISFNEPQHSCTSSCPHPCLGIADAITDIILNSICCLASYEFVSASFPFNKFSFILEYGGSNISSRISSICTKSNSLPALYFLKVELKGSCIAETLTYGVDMHKSIEFEMKWDFKSALAQKENKNTLEELICDIPLKETHGKHVDAEYDFKHCNMMPIQSVPVGLESKQNFMSKAFSGNTVIIVNTRNFIEEMIISRRSTYKKILEMEQEGAQVVERDIGLPVDIILSPAVCLTWYESRNIGKKVSAPDEAFSCLPLCLESIATSILTSLSFAFSCCILIFEGECSFLCSIMESSDELYAAAASLGINLQIFCSYSSEMTEEIILSCINVAAKLTRGLYPRMSDTESLAESFLTSFPSINPLTAHSILSLDMLLGTFLELSIEDRIQALQIYKVPDESIALMSATSRYGEREDSKSGVTDCSSSLSIPDLKIVQLNTASEGRKPNHPQVVYTSGSPDISNRSEFTSLSDKKLANHDIDINMMTIDKLSHSDFLSTKDLCISDEKKDAWMPHFDLDCSPKWKTTMSQTSNFKRQNDNVTCIPRENFTGEVINVDDTLPFQDLFPAKSNSFSLDIGKECSARNSKIYKLPLTTASLPMFPSSEVDSAPDAWLPKNEKQRIMREDIKPHFDIINKNDISMGNQKGFMEYSMMGKAPQNFHKLSSREKGIQSFGGTPLSNALHSTQVQQGSPWTIEFLNRIKEKSRLRSRSSYELSSPCHVSSGNTSKSTKRKSPSILEFYKYERGSTPQKTVERKRPKRSSQQETSWKNMKASSSCPQSWTPVDKRARQALSFSTNGSGGQSKLVWRDTPQRRL
ncbi:protein SHORTAGE IN CHIASMATA 1 [Andrographis paniculata]|uniref:protein SHORTAGE IN CHIASMATA 1 n=1 Tax=Andrographis paniculata TaxID=175694 RepID=UPI0021E95FAA|nr:protein SHORTAGE IN CHIASMATA 1 [Andrographis paniculata]